MGNLVWQWGVAINGPIQSEQGSHSVQNTIICSSRLKICAVGGEKTANTTNSHSFNSSVKNNDIKNCNAG
jgi:hypothetical protein